MMKPQHPIGLHEYLSGLREQGLYRERHVSRQERKIDFSQNDYLSLASDDVIQQAYQQGFKAYPIGSGGSMLVCGYHPIHQILEQSFARALNVDACLLFSSGYVANLSLMILAQTLGRHVLIDKAVHASIYDGIRLSGVSYTRFLHNCLIDLSEKIRTVPKGSFLITESVFSMSGQIAPLDSIAALCREHEVEFIVDEAHAFGVYGDEGLGAVNAYGLTQNDIPLRVIPFGKSFNASGALVAGRASWIEALLQCARPHRYSTSISPAFCFGLLKTLEVVRKADDKRRRLFDLVDYFQQQVKGASQRWRNSQSPIQQLQMGCPHKALAQAAQLQAHGISCTPIRPPTVSRQETGLRIILNAGHEHKDIDCLLDFLSAS